MSLNLREATASGKLFWNRTNSLVRKTVGILKKNKNFENSSNIKQTVQIFGWTRAVVNPAEMTEKHTFDAFTFYGNKRGRYWKWFWTIVSKISYLSSSSKIQTPKWTTIAKISNRWIKRRSKRSIHTTPTEGIPSVGQLYSISFTFAVKSHDSKYTIFI